jgi:hypothetical protein
VVFAANVEKNCYAKALNGCVLYKSQEMNNDYNDILFIVPETYFVLILDVIDEDKCYMVQYDKYIGYVSPKFVEIATFNPIVKTLENITFDIRSNVGTQIWSAPSTKSDIYTTLSAGTKSVKYIASVEGMIPIGCESNIWYYVLYTPNDNSTNVYEGYIYSENTINLSEIISNNETNPEVISNNVFDDDLIYISSTIKTIVVAIIAIPIILFIAIILYKLVKKIRKTTKYDKNINLLNDQEVDENLKNKNANMVNKFKSMLRLKNDKNHSNLDIQDDELL